jgi:hypothetical protein
MFCPQCEEEHAKIDHLLRGDGLQDLLSSAEKRADRP